MRILGGKWKGRRLKAPSGIKTRPFRSVVKEAIFHILKDYLLEAHVLDLFAGSGSLGLEALSRGAKEVTFVEKSKHALSVIYKNIAELQVRKQCHVWKMAFPLGKNRLLKKNPFHCVFLDPPFLLWKTQKKDFLLFPWEKLLSPDGVLIVHTALSHTPKEDFFPTLTLWKRKTYQKEQVSLFLLKSSL